MKTILVVSLIIFILGTYLWADTLSDGREAERRGDAPAAVECYRKALVERPDDSRARTALRRVQKEVERRRLKMEAEARRKAREESFVSKDEEGRLKESRDQRLEEGRRLLSNGDLLSSWDVFQRLLDENPGFRPAQQGLDKAQKVLQQRIQRGEFPSPRHYAAAQGVVLFGEGRWTDAARFLEKSLEGGPLPSDLASARVAEYAALARRRATPAGAGTSLTPLLTRSGPEEPPLSPETLDESERLFREGLRLYGADRPAEARERFTKALALNPKHAEAREALERLEGVSDEKR